MPSTRKVERFRPQTPKNGLRTPKNEVGVGQFGPENNGGQLTDWARELARAGERYSVWAGSWASPSSRRCRSGKDAPALSVRWPGRWLAPRRRVQQRSSWAAPFNWIRCKLGFWHFSAPCLHAAAERQHSRRRDRGWRGSTLPRRQGQQCRAIRSAAQRSVQCSAERSAECVAMPSTFIGQCSAVREARWQRGARTQKQKGPRSRRWTRG